MGRVLIAEDEQIARRLITQYVRRYAECDVASDGQEAVDLFEAALREQRPYEVVFLDIMMPRLDGQQVLADGIQDL